jgi:hypothetical protein
MLFLLFQDLHTHKAVCSYVPLSTVMDCSHAILQSGGHIQKEPCEELKGTLALYHSSTLYLAFSLKLYVVQLNWPLF